jgi:hypothetical protein
MDNYEVIKHYISTLGTLVELVYYPVTNTHIFPEWGVNVTGEIDDMPTSIRCTNEDFAHDMYLSYCRIATLNDSIAAMTGQLTALQHRYNAAGV